MSGNLVSLVVGCPEWVDAFIDWDAAYTTDEAKMRMAIEVATQNVRRKTGGPFGAAIFEASTGRLLSVGVNSVVRLNNSVLHAEMLAIMLGEQRLGSYTLHHEGHEHVLVTSCDPCAMCLGAALWSGIRRLVTGARRDDASAIAFDEGPVFPESYAYLESRGISITRGVLRAEAAAVLELYRQQGGPLYNAYDPMTARLHGRQKAPN
jgi:tRNA(Arg) A34 adenosine deaminase TadA